MVFKLHFKYLVCQKGFVLFELVVVIAMIGILTSLAMVDWDLLLEKQQIKTTLNTTQDAIQQAQLDAVVQGQKKRLDIDGQELWISNSPSLTNRILFDRVSDNIDLVIKGKLIFSPSGFGTAGSISIDSPNYSTKIIVSSIGSVRYEEITLNK